MSIYATLWEIQVLAEEPKVICFGTDGTATALYGDGSRRPYAEKWVRVVGQGVPPHIGHPSHYPSGDPYGAFLPPPVSDAEGDLLRAVVIVVEGREDKEGQCYVDPLLVLSGVEYQRLSFADLLARIEIAVRKEV